VKFQHIFLLDLYSTLQEPAWWQILSKAQYDPRQKILRETYYPLFTIVSWHPNIFTNLNTETAEEPAEKAPEPKKQKTTTATKKAAEPRDKSTDGNAEKKKPGRPKGSGSSDKPKKEKKEFRVGQALRKTRSQGTA